MNVDYDKLKKERIRSALKVLKALDLEALVVTTHDNVRYLTDQKTLVVVGWEPNCAAVLTKDGEVFSQVLVDYIAPSPLWTNDREALAKERFWSSYSLAPPTAITDIWVDWIARALNKLGVKKGRVGLDRAPWQWYLEMRKRIPGIEIVDADEDLLLTRAVKNSEEVKLLEKAGAIAAKGMDAGIDAVRAGVSEYEIYRICNATMYAEGSEGDAFHPFLSAGLCKTGTLYPANRMLKEGDPIQIDLGPIIEGYCGDISRTGYVGKPTKEFKELYRVVYDSLYAVIKNARPGVKMSELTELQSKVIRERGYDEPGMDYGHGVGMLHCCEYPTLLRKGDYRNIGRKDMVLQPNMFFTSEPRLYKMVGKDTWIQCALEDTMMVTDLGCEVITPAHYITEIVG